MLKSISVVSIVVAVALAQGSTLIPSGISDGCSTFLNNLNTNDALQKCTGTLSQGLAAFNPGSTTPATSSSVSSALTAVCGASVATDCPTSVFASQITGFYTACSTELTTSPNADVIKIYDVLYVIPAMREAICSKDDDGSWCVASAAPPSGSADSVQQALYTKSGDNVVPNTNTFTTYNIPFLFLTPETPEADLCKTCTRNVLKAFINHESNLPYAPGLGESPLLKTQTALYTAVKSKCGENFMISEIKAAGGLSNNGLNGVLNKSGAVARDASFSSLVAAAAGVASLAALF